MENNGKRPTFLENLIAWGGKVLSKLSKLVDRIVFNRTGSLLLTLVLSLGICLSIDYDKLATTLFSDTTTSTNVSNVPVNVNYDSELYEISGIPENVSVTLTGQASDIQMFRQQYGVSVSSNMEKYGAGKAYLDFSVDNLPNTITATVVPSDAEVMIEKKIKKTFTVIPKLMVGSNQKEDEFETPILEKTTVEIVGTKEQFNRIRTIEAIVDAYGYTSDFDTDAAVVAYDSTGNQVDVRISPATIHATVKLKQVSLEPKEKDAKESNENKGD